MAVVKIEALKYLADLLKAAIPELEGKICVGQAMPNHDLAFPSLAIVPVGRWRFIPDQDGDDTGVSPLPDRVVMNVGRHDVTIQLQLACATQDQRYELEQQIERFFLGTELHPGVVFGAVNACEDDVGEFVASFMLDDSEWQDGKAFQQQSWSYIDVLASIPALVTRAGVYTMNEIQLGLTEVFSPNPTSATFTTDATIERIVVQDDGSITAP